MVVSGCFSGMTIAVTLPLLFPLLSQGGGNDSIDALGRRRIRRVTQMVRFALLNSVKREHFTFTGKRTLTKYVQMRCCKCTCWTGQVQQAETAQKCPVFVYLNMGLMVTCFYVQSSSVIPSSIKTQTLFDLCLCFHVRKKENK